MSRQLRIAGNLSLPLDAVTQTFAILGIRGSGKTNTAVVMMEEMLKHGQQCVAIDPTNAWYGIRSSRDGKSAGFKVYMFGGPNGDLPLEGTHGTIMADFVVETGASVVFSLRHLSMNDQRRFAMEFGERLHHLKGKPENRTPLCLYLDEADEVVPQRIPKGHERMFGAYDRLVRRDRNCGLGVVLISQRPQVINKDTLSQIETLICHRLLHKLDRKSVKEAWVEGHDIKGKADEFFGALASLGKGDTWVWSPEWLDIFKRVHIRERETFDSSATPKAGERPKIAHKLAEVDLDKLKERLSETIQKAKEDDPRTLRAEISRLQKEIKAVASGKGKERVVEKSSAADRALIKRLHAALGLAIKIITNVKAFGFDNASVSADEVKSILDRASVQIASIAESAITSRSQEFDKLKRNAETVLAKLEQLMAGEDVELNVNITRNDPVTVRIVSPQRSERPSASASAQRTTISNNGDHPKLRDGAERMLSALCQFHPGGMPDGRLRSHAGLKKSGTYSAYKSDLFRGGYIEKRGGDLFATQTGIDYFGGHIPDAPQSTEDVLAIWGPKLREGARRMLDRLIAHGGELVTREQLFEESKLEKSGTASAYLSDLKRAQLALVSRDGIAANRETLFL